MNIKLNKQTMIDILYGAKGIIQDNIISHMLRRWSVVHQLIFEYEGKVYQTFYSTGECQDERPWQYDEEVECTEMKEVEKVIKVYLEVE